MLVLPKFDYHEPKEMSDACKILSDVDGDAKIIAGGTDILVNMKKGVLTPKCLVSLARIPGLNEAGQVRGGITIGSHFIVAKLGEFELIKTRFPVIAKAASMLGSPLIRNRATIGGNIVTARPAADLPPPLLALGARVSLESTGGTREVPLEGFFTGPGQTVLNQDEVLSKIIIDDMPPHTGADYIKLGHRNSLEIAIVAVASRITLDKPDGTIMEARIILSSVAPKAIHAVSAEGALTGKKPTPELFEEAGRLAGGDCTPIDDIRGSAAYRCAMVEVLTRRSLTAAFEQARAH